MEQEKLSLEQSVSALQKTVSELSKLVEEHKERERLLVAFPDLHMPVEAQFESEPRDSEGGSAGRLRAALHGNT